MREQVNQQAVEFAELPPHRNAFTPTPEGGANIYLLQVCGRRARLKSSAGMGSGTGSATVNGGHR